jgi:hypothetical protein
MTAVIAATLSLSSPPAGVGMPWIVEGLLNMLTE